MRKECKGESYVRRRLASIRHQLYTLQNVIKAHSGDMTSHAKMRIMNVLDDTLYTTRKNSKDINGKYNKVFKQNGKMVDYIKLI